MRHSQRQNIHPPLKFVKGGSLVCYAIKGCHSCSGPRPTRARPEWAARASQVPEKVPLPMRADIHHVFLGDSGWGAGRIHSLPQPPMGSAPRGARTAAHHVARSAARP